MGLNKSRSLSIPQHMHCTSEKNLIETIYGHMNNHDSVPLPDFFCNRAILALRNDDICNLNSITLTHLPGEEQTYSSADSYSIESPTQEDNPNILVEFLHSLNVFRLPVADLHLKLGCPIILLYNIDKKWGLCNETCATITQISSCFLQICILTGNHAGEMALIP
jgi:hypothetical protein